MPPDAPPVVTGAYQLQLVTVEIPDLDGGWPVALLRPPGRGPTAFVSLRPTVGRRDDERPEIGMTVVLERRPVPDEPDLSTIAGTGALGLVLSLAPPGSVRSRVQDVAGGPTAPAFARPAEVSVESAGRVLASGRAWGPEPGVSLSLLLDRAEVEDVLAALAGQAGRLDVRVVVDVAPPGIGTRSTRVEQVTGLDLVIGGQLGAEDRARSIHMVCPGRLGQLDAVPPRVATPPATHSGSKEGPVATRSPLALVRQADQVRSLPLVLTPDRASAPDARRLVGSDLARPVFTTSESVRWTLPDVVVQPTTDPPLALPIVDGTDATVFVDRLDPSTRWYTPAFELVLPAADEDPAASPFLFTFMSSGSVLGANGLQIGLRGKLSFTVRTVMKPETRAILAALGNPPASPVPLGNMAIDVEVPFRTQASSQTSTQRFSADVEDNGDGTFGATVEMLDDWVRLAYGSLSVAGFQDIPVRAAVTYAYRSYVPVPPLDPGLGILVGGKINRIDWLHVRRAGQPGPGDPVAAVDLGASTVTFAKEAPAGPATRARPGFVLASSAVLNATATLNATAVLQAPEPPASLLQMQTQVQGESVDVVVPCSTFGGFYRRHDGATDTPVGCQDALRLGETQPRLYEELPAQRSPRWAVWRSLTQPGRFLVVPRTYRITRYGPDEPAERAYRPVAIIHGTIDPDPSRNRYFLSASLQPDMTYAERQQLIRDLAPLSPHDVVPVIEWPTDASVG
ncbi:MAG: hypothetical protein ACXV95_06285, partial [Acidimicrobiales bacterium]